MTWVLGWALGVVSILGLLWLLRHELAARHAPAPERGPVVQPVRVEQIAGCRFLATCDKCGETAAIHAHSRLDVAVALHDWGHRC